MKHRLSAILIGLIILGTGFTSLGRVYWQWRPGSGQAIFDSLPEWRRIYQSSIRINSSRGHLEILGCDDPLPRVINKLKTAFASSDPAASFYHSPSAGWVLIQTDTLITRILALNLGTPAQTVIFVLTQSPDNYAQSLQPPDTHLLAAPFYPGSTVKSFIENETASAQMEISSTPVSPQSILSFFDSAFTQNGYHRIPAGTGAVDTGFIIFQKDQSLCCVLVQVSPQTHESVITVLHKQLKM